MRLILLSLILIYGCYLGSSTQDSLPIRGKIYVTGNEPFTELAIQSDDGKVYIISKNSPVYKQLWENQGSIVILEKGKFETKGMEKGKILVQDFKVLSK